MLTRTLDCWDPLASAVFTGLYPRASWARHIELDPSKLTLGMLNAQRFWKPMIALMLLTKACLTQIYSLERFLIDIYSKKSKLLVQKITAKKFQIYCICRNSPKVVTNINLSSISGNIDHNYNISLQKAWFMLDLVLKHKIKITCPIYSKTALNLSWGTRFFANLNRIT